MNDPVPLFAGRPWLYWMLLRVVTPLVISVSLPISCTVLGLACPPELIGAAQLAFILAAFLASDHLTARISGRIDERGEFFSVFLESGLVVVIAVAVNFGISAPERFEWPVIIAWGTTAALLAAVTRIYGLRALVWHTLARPKHRFVVVGINSTAEDFIGRVVNHPLLGGECVGFFEDRNQERVSPARGINAEDSVPRRLGKIAETAAYVKRNRIEVLYVSIAQLSDARLKQLFRDLSDTTVSIYYIHDIKAFNPIGESVSVISGVPTFGICVSPMGGVAALAKDAFDRGIAALALLLLLPVLLITAAAIRLESRGPVIFRQKRYGVDGQEITIFKFRSMCQQDQVAPGAVLAQATRGDARITRVGAFIRKTSIDELPQLLNVLAGSMSLVGPRPHAVQHNEQYRQLIEGYMLRHKVKPGITGLAQIRGCRGETDTIDKMERRIFFDLEYIRNWSFFRDVAIILLTVPQMLGHRNAY